MGVLKCLLNKEKIQSLLQSEGDGFCNNAIQDRSELTILNYKDCSDSISKLRNVFQETEKCTSTCVEYGLSSSEYHLYVGDVHAFIPTNHFSGHVHSDFGLEIINDDSYFPTVNPTQCICSPIVRTKPHGTKFHCTDPAIIILPLTVRLDANDVITCLCSDTNINEDPVWELLNPNDYEVCGSFIKLRTTHFSFFTAVISKHYPEASRMIYAGVGGTLDIPEVPGVQVTFPGSAVKYDIEATVKVMYADGPYDVDHFDPTSYALAAPVVKLGPTGHKFNPDSIEPVQVQLPLPHWEVFDTNWEVFDTNWDQKDLTFWQSTTAEGQELEWKEFKTNFRIIHDEKFHSFVCFPVAHFTFFRVLWSVLDSAIHRAKIGASFFYPNFEFCISFQAFMSECGGGAFGLCCLCYRKGTTPESIGNYPVFVGSSGLRMVKRGLLRIRIVSNLFKANVAFGEKALIQQEFFIGHPFDKQFACKIIGPRTLGHSTIGKIYIERVLENNDTELLFDFILIKPPSSEERPRTASNGHHNRRAEIDHQSNWELSQELANILSIKTDQDLCDGVWEDIARALSYTSLEIDMIFKDSDKPFTKLLEDYKKCGGSPNDFIAAMYSVGRNAKLSSFERRLSDILPSSGGREVEDDVAGCAGSISPSHTSSSSGVILPAAPINSQKRRHTDIPQGPISDAKLSEVAERVKHKWKRLGRTLDLREDQIIEIERDYQSDGIQEQAYQMLLAWRESYPDNGYETLSQALGKLSFNAVARQLYFSP